VSADLRDAEGDGAEAAGEGFGLITVCIALARVGTLVGLGFGGRGDVRCAWLR
jgi:hypothetical protein